MYNYNDEKKELFTDEGQRMFLRIRDNAKRLLKDAGAARMEEMISHSGGGSSWTMLACVDRLVELGEIREINQGKDVSGQYRIFVAMN